MRIPEVVRIDPLDETGKAQACASCRKDIFDVQVVEKFPLSLKKETLLISAESFKEAFSKGVFELMALEVRCVGEEG